MAKKVISKNIFTQSIHPWRLCAPGRHWVREHSLQIPPSKKNPGFNPNILANKKDKNSARGLLQVTNESRKILGSEKGELKNHYLTLTREDLNDPGNNICAGIRWLFRKREIASSLLKKTASWEEAIYEFKGGRSTSKERARKLMNEFNKAFKELSKCGKL